MLVKEKKTGVIYAVYDIAYDSAGFPLFLLYDGTKWVRKSAKFFVPVSSKEAASS